MKLLLMIFLSFNCFAKPFFKKGDRVKMKRSLTLTEAINSCTEYGRVIKIKKNSGKYKYMVRLDNCLLNRWFEEAKIR